MGNKGRKCPNCNSSNYTESISIERCHSCGYEVDYWGNGGNAVADAYESRRAYAAEKARWERERQEDEEHRQWYEENN